jgi:DNA-binding LytR/AlgR family response regulator
LARAARSLEERSRAERAAELERMVKHLRQDRYDGKHTYDFWIRERDQRIRVGIEQVRYMEAARDYIVLHTGERQHMVRKTMSDIEREVDPRVMVRVHRSYFVNVKAVESLQMEEGRLNAVELTTGDIVPVGPAYQNVLRLALRTVSA